MTIGELRALCVMASYGVPHADLPTTLDILRYLTPEEHDQADFIGYEDEAIVCFCGD